MTHASYQTRYHTVGRAYPAHLLSATSISTDQVLRLIERAQSFYSANHQPDKKHGDLRGRTLINLFYENSTRTRTSFELAGKRLGMDVVNINAQASSAKKGETLIDTAATLNAMRPDALVLRHPQSGAADLFAEYVTCPVINAGDGSHQHPTQALLDAFTINRLKGRIAGLRVAICGDISHSRVARSNLQLLTLLGASIVLIAPPQLMPSQAQSLGCDLSHHMDDGLRGADVVMMLRIQHERMEGLSLGSVRDYFSRYGLTYERFALAKPDALLMHPGPINRGVEIETSLADAWERNAILDQVEAGVAMRQALLVDLLTNKAA